MKKIFIGFLITSGLFFSVQSKAQEVQKGMPGMYAESVDFKNTPVAFNKGSVILADDNGKMSSSTSALLKNSEKDNLNMEHYRYQQSYQGIPVEHATYIIHVKNNNVISQNGKWVKDFPSLLTASPTLSANDALRKAINFVGAKTYKWQLTAEEAFIKREQNNPAATFYPTIQLVYYSGEDEVVPAAMRLAYKLDIYAQYPMSRQIVFVDAVSGNILGKRELIHATNAAGSAVTAYSGTQAITTDFTGTTYRLRETGRGLGINTYNMKAAGTSYAAAVDFTDADNVWNNVNVNKDQYATDGHWGTEQTYDFYFSKFGRSSVDNAGFALNSYVHTNLVAFGYGDNVNAFWDGSRMTYGDGNATYSPLTALDICGHEITHGVTERTSNLVYSNESGAMNEAFSDIFGTAIEFYAKGTGGNWLIGENISAAFRSMSNPNQFSQPDTYQGTFWYTGTADNGGVHTNSGVLNYWFYLLSVGGSGTNDKGTAFTVTGIGIDKAAAIAYRTNTFYLVSTSNYAAARTNAIKSAEDLYGIGSVEATQTACAFAAVGIGTCGTIATCATPTALTSSVITTSGATLGWTAASGAISYLVEYKTSAATVWTVLASATTATSASVSGLSASTLYNWRVTTNCSAAISTAATASFTTAAVAGGCASAFEPNETLATAIAVSSGVVNSAAISSTTDIDYYKIVTTATSSNVFNLVGPTGVDYDLYIYNSAGTQIGTGTSATATETISLTGQAAGTYYIKVIGYSGANSATCYTIKATATLATGCISVYDNTTNGTTAGAATIPFNTNITGLINTTTDVDNYKFVITTAGTITITLGTLPADFDLKLLNSAGTQIAISQNGSTTAETISYTAAAGTYYAQAFGYNGANSTTTCYTLKVQLGTATIFGNTNEIASNKAILKVYPSPASDILNVSVLGETNGKGIIKVVNINGAVVMQQKINNSVQQVNISRLAKGIYMLKIENGSSLLSSKFIKQ
jgi:bacillolysin